MAKPNPFAGGKKAPPFGKSAGGGGKAPPFAKKGAMPPEAAPMPFKKGGKVK